MAVSIFLVYLPVVTKMKDGTVWCGNGFLFSYENRLISLIKRPPIKRYWIDTQNLSFINKRTFSCKFNSKSKGTHQTIDLIKHLISIGYLVFLSNTFEIQTFFVHIETEILIEIQHFNTYMTITFSNLDKHFTQQSLWIRCNWVRVRWSRLDKVKR